MTRAKLFAKFESLFVLNKGVLEPYHNEGVKMRTAVALCPDCAGKYHEAAEQTLPYALQLLDKNEHRRKGGYFCIGDALGEVLDLFLVGSVPREKAFRYRELAQEKIRRLAAHPGHRTSYQSRNPALDHWGGAVRIRNPKHTVFFSFSGLSPDTLDEALVLMVAMQTGLVDQKVALRIAGRASGKYLKQLMDRRGPVVR